MSNQESQSLGGNTIFNISVNGIRELDEVVSWYKNRQLMERMA